MLVIRTVQPDDLSALHDLTAHTGFGLTTLPHDRDVLRRRIEKSVRSILHMGDQPAGESYLLVMEDSESHALVGTAGVTSKVGGFEPFYAYRIETSALESSVLKIRKEHRVLHLVAEHNGPCEIGSLFLLPSYRRDGNGRMLSLSRFLFMAEHSRCFDPTVLAEMRGVVDETGRSPFWEALGKHFFDIDYPRADYLSMVNKRFIAELMPRHPLYITLLPPEAQAVIGQVHEQTRPALRVLETEGFKPSGMVDMFDGGPIVSCQVEEIRAVRLSRRAELAAIGDVSDSAKPSLICNTRTDFRAVRGMVIETSDGRVQLDAATATALRVSVGETIRHVPLPVSKAATS